VQLVQAFKTTKTCRPDRPWGAYGIRNGQYVYRCPRLDRHTAADSIIEPAVRTAAEAIEWDRPLPPLEDRSVPLVATTRSKLLAGWHRHQHAASRLSRPE
jgi:DNA (cytosine-5)-methyltransferase 1